MLLNVDDALTRILSQIHTLPMGRVALADALGRTLAQDIQSAVNIPHFANSSMDGYALRAADTAGATQERPVRLKLVMDIPAGTAPDQAIAQGQAARIMTGAPMPQGADAVIPVEDTDGQWSGESLPETVRVFRSVEAGDYVRPAGEDIQQGETILKAGTVLRPQEIGVLAAVGQAEVPVIRPPRVVVLTTGDELLTVDEPLAPGKIRDVNSYTLVGLLQEAGAIPVKLPIGRDTLESVRELFQRALDQHPDMMISSAGVSVGAADLVRTVLDELGQVDLWRINLRPGKPLAFGFLQKVPFFGLPGNPVSAMVTFDVIVRPALMKQMGRGQTITHRTAITGEPIQSDGRRSYLRVKLQPGENGQLIATTTGTQSSGALMSMVLADGLLIVPEGVTNVPAGTPLEVRLLRQPIEKTE